MSIFTDNERCLRISLFTLLLVVLLAGLSGNIIICHTFRKTSSLHTVTNLIIINMAVTAITHCLLNIPVSLANLALDRWPLGDLFCQINGFTNSVCLFESMFSLVVLSCSRYWCILHPSRFQAIFSKRHTLLMIASSWLLASTLSSLPLFGWSHFHWYSSKMMCVSIWRHSISYTSFVIITVFIVPSSAITGIYYKIYRHIKYHQRLLKLCEVVTTATVCPTTMRRRKHSKSIFKDYKVTKLIWTLFVLFIASWVPYFAVNLGFESLEDTIPRDLDAILTWTTIFNTACSPIVYGLVNRQFRKRFWESVRCFKKRIGKSRHHRRTTSRFRESTDMLRTCPQTSRTPFHDANAGAMVVMCVSAV